MLPALLLIIALSLTIVLAAIIPHAGPDRAQARLRDGMVGVTYAMLMAPRWLILANVICIAVARGGFAWTPTLGAGSAGAISLLMAAHGVLGAAALLGLRDLLGGAQPGGVRWLAAIGTTVLGPLVTQALLAVESISGLGSTPWIQPLRLIAIANVGLAAAYGAWALLAPPLAVEGQSAQRHAGLMEGERPTPGGAIEPHTVTEAKPGEPLVEWMSQLASAPSAHARARTVALIRARPNLAVEYARLLQSGSRFTRSVAMRWMLEVRPPITGETLDAARGMLLARADHLRDIIRASLGGEVQDPERVNRLLHECWSAATYLDGIGQDVRAGALAVCEAASELPNTPERGVLLADLRAIAEHERAGSAA